MSIRHAKLGPAAPDVCNTIIEIPRYSTNKYEIDQETGIIKLDQHPEALLERAGQRIGQGEGLFKHRIAAAVEAGRSRAERRNADAMTGAA